jgi:LuxR family maltose regulon positive regulatory protein
LSYLAGSLTTPEIAGEMILSVNTVRTHIKNIYQKLGVHKRSAAVRQARALGLF